MELRGRLKLICPHWLLLEAFVTDQQESQRSSPKNAPNARHCQKCEKPLRFFTSILDVKRNKMVLIYQCNACGEEVWD